MPLLFALLVTGNSSAFDEFKRSFFDDTFAGIHKLAPFDYALLAPYFAILIVLSFFGMHRYEMIRGYFKGRKNLPTQPPVRFEELPPITVQLPLFNERFVVERLIEQIVKLDYPKHLLQIQVLDDSTDETHPFTERLVAEYRAAGHPIEYHHRTNRHGFKAGALQEGLKTATGEIVAVFDADSIVPEDFLKKNVHYFADPYGKPPVAGGDPALEAIYRRNIATISAINRQRGVRTLWIGQLLVCWRNSECN